MLNKEHFKKWFQTKFNFTQKGTIGVNGKTSTYKSVSDVASLYYKACDEFAMDTDWKLSDCEALIEELQNVVYDERSEKAVIADDGTQTIDQIDGLFYSLADNYHFILD